jgi:uncharacterized protein with LGFP repeats
MWLDGRSRYFAPTRHAVRGDFLSYFETHGGAASLGFPIAEPLVVNGWLVQDFELGRLVWAADGGAGVRVEREPIGEVWVQRQGGELLAPIPCPGEALVER